MSRLLPVFAALLMMVFFAACEKDEIDTEGTTPITPPTTTIVTSPVASRIANNGTQAQSSSASGIEIECIEVDVPFDFDIDGVIFTINDSDEFADVLSNNITANTMGLDFVYPLNVTLEDGTSAVVADGTELAVLVSACVPGTGWGNGQFPAFFFDAAPCLSLSYPVALEDMNGAVITAVDEVDFISILAANPALLFVFPLNVVDSSGATVTVVDEVELFDLLAECFWPGSGAGHGGSSGIFSIFGDGCFDINYPLNIVDFNGVVVAVADENDFSVAIISGDFADFEYPFSVTLTDGTIVPISDADDFKVMMDECLGVTFDFLDVQDFIEVSWGFGGDSCYALVYPFVIEVNGIDTFINESTGAVDFLNGTEVGTVVFPVEVFDIGLGSQITLTSAQDYFDLLLNCFSSGLGVIRSSVFLSMALNNGGSCYTLAYPITISNSDGTKSTLTSEAEAISRLTSRQEGTIDFPVDVVETATGSTVTLANESEYLALYVSCQ